MSNPGPDSQRSRAKQGTREWWISHFIDAHKHTGTPSPAEMREFKLPFYMVMKDHMALHRHFKTGHEHVRGTGAIVRDN